MRRASGVLAIYQGKLCIISASNGKGWTIPKGGVEPGMTKKESAAKEAFEEAGLIGHVKDKIAEIEFTKAGVKQQVALFTMQVSLLADDYPERKTRKRKLVGKDEALRKLPEYYHSALKAISK